MKGRIRGWIATGFEAVVAVGFVLGGIWVIAFLGGM